MVSYLTWFGGSSTSKGVSRLIERCTELISISSLLGGDECDSLTGYAASGVVAVSLLPRFGIRERDASVASVLECRVGGGVLAGSGSLARAQAMR